MNASATARSESGSSPTARADQQTFAHVEKWLAVIREISPHAGSDSCRIRGAVSPNPKH
ncbi:MAG: hypothetical protein KGL96_13530 [Hyphomicrobiales bacterium]|nr:hypothetical protein [Hyphomicrobiales bacterium]